MGSLQDALLKTGLADERKKSAGRKREDQRRQGNKSRKKGAKPQPGSVQHQKGAQGRGGAGAGGRSSASDLERAWIARRKAEKAEKERAKQARVADQEARRKRNLELDGIVDGKVLNDDNAELPRYFEHLGRIRRVMCTPEQRAAINAGELAVVNLRGRYLIVEPAVLARYRALAPDLVPDLGGAEPEAPDDERDDYPPVPDDLTW
ncbi:MAG: DUF2058 family protein [Wenzhouxiangellaceae bacterium]